MDNTQEDKVILSQMEYLKEGQSFSTSKFLLIRFIVDLFSYIRLRVRQFSLFLYAGIVSFSDIFSDIKSWSVRRMYWGRSSLYRSAFHVIIFTITLGSLFVGITNRINVLNNGGAQKGLVLAEGVIGNSDTLYQAGTTETIVASSPTSKNWPEYTHVVQKGETIDSIAAQYNVSTATIKWANNLNSDNLKVDQVLTVPGLDGVLYEAKNGDTVDKIVKSKVIQNANAFDLIELNNLEPPDYKITAGQQLFIPNAIKIVNNPTVAAGSATYIKLVDPGIDVPPGTFINPLTYCPGYNISRGILPWHNGVDMAKPGGCWINATADGTVIRAEWGTNMGFNVAIDHHNGFISYYFHGNGEFAVQKGDEVKAGQKIMYMGSTGNSTGTHLHFEMHYNGGLVDPMNYVKL